jgi:hypothetical protein
MCQRTQSRYQPLTRRLLFSLAAALPSLQVVDLVGCDSLAGRIPVHRRAAPPGKEFAAGRAFFLPRPRSIVGGPELKPIDGLSIAGRQHGRLAWQFVVVARGRTGAGIPNEQPSGLGRPRLVDGGVSPLSGLDLPKRNNLVAGSVPGFEVQQEMNLTQILEWSLLNSPKP